jgi:hypothetical protein
MDACTATLTAFAGEHSIGLTRFASVPAQFEIIDRATLKATGRIPFAANPRAGA